MSIGAVDRRALHRYAKLLDGLHLYGDQCGSQLRYPAMVQRAAASAGTANGRRGMSRSSILCPRQRARRCKSPSALRGVITCVRKHIDDAVVIGWPALAASWQEDLEYIEGMLREMLLRRSSGG